MNCACVLAKGLSVAGFKLENVLLSEAGEAVLCDFELLREEAAFKDSSGTTSTVVGGTPAYMAPERVQGGAPSRGDKSKGGAGGNGMEW